MLAHILCRASVGHGGRQEFSSFSTRAGTGREAVTVADDVQPRPLKYYKDAPILPKNAARHSGSIKWVRGLRERVEAPMDKIRGLNKLVLDTEEAKRIFEDHAVLLKAMTEFEEEHVKAWVGQVSQVCPIASVSATL